MIVLKKKKGNTNLILKNKVDTDNSMSTSSPHKRGRHGFKISPSPTAAPNDTGMKGKFNLVVGALNIGVGDLLAAETDLDFDPLL